MSARPWVSVTCRHEGSPLAHRVFGADATDANAVVAMLAKACEESAGGEVVMYVRFELIGAGSGHPQRVLIAGPDD